MRRFVRIRNLCLIVYTSIPLKNEIILGDFFNFAGTKIRENRNKGENLR